MPRGDRTGPAGAGPMTGRRMGYCTGHNTPGYLNPQNQPGFGRGFWGGGRHRGCYGNAGPAWGWGRGWGWNYAPQPLTKEQEISGLQSFADQLQEQLTAIKNRIDELNKEE